MELITPAIVYRFVFTKLTNTMLYNLPWLYNTLGNENQKKANEILNKSRIKYTWPISTDNKSWLTISNTRKTRTLHKFAK